MAIIKTLLAATALFNVAVSGIAHSSDVEFVVTSIQLLTSVTFVDAPATCTTLTVTESAPPSTVTVVAPPAVSGTGVASSAKSSAKSSMHVTIETSVASSVDSSVSSMARPTETCISSVHTLTHNSKVMTVTGCHLPPGLTPPTAEPTPTLTKTLTSTTSKVETVILPSSSTSHDFTGTAIPGTAIKPSGYPSPPPLSSGHLPHMPSGHSSHSFHINSTMTATGTGVASASASWTKPTLPAFTDAADASNVGAALLFGGVFMALFGA